MNVPSARLNAFYALKSVIAQKKSLRECLPPQLDKLGDARDKGLCHEIVYGTLRQYPSLVQTLSPFLRKPLKAKSDIEILLASALYQLIHLNVPDYAVVSETLTVAEHTKQHKLKGLINAILRQFLRDNNPNKVATDSQHNHPNWLYAAITQSYPEQAIEIFQQNLTAPNLTLRIRDADYRDEYLDKMAQKDIDASAHPDVPTAILLHEKVAFNQLPDAALQPSTIVVQDANAQLAATLLDLQPNHDVLDACAAPGGKSLHLKDDEPTINLTAVELNQMRGEQMRQYFTLQDADITVKIGDATTVETWFKGKQFDRILLDAPCSGTGVIRKHPDILHHRRENDITQLVALQKKLLAACFAALKPSGKLLYATCSILPKENQQQIEHFLSHTPSASISSISHPRTTNIDGTLQFLPNEYGTGFFYALIKKRIR